MSDFASGFSSQFAATRALTEAIATPMSDADATVQSMPDASPAKWHLAHTTWFWETFLLRDHVPGYRVFDDRFAYLFNSYYQAEGPRHARISRGLLSRPTLDAVLEWRHYVTAHMAEAITNLAVTVPELLALGRAHEQQHQELMLTDILHLMAQNPCGPAIWANDIPVTALKTAPPKFASLRWIDGGEGQVDIGQTINDFFFDCEGPRHPVLLPRHALASACVTNHEWATFIADGGYRNPALWLSDGWDWVQREAIHAPLYWQNQGGDAADAASVREHFTLAGWQPLDMAAPVSHISLYEADAFASWAAAQWTGARLPTEAEWENAACVAHADASAGNQLDAAGPVAPQADCSGNDGLSGMFGDVWEWTGSAFRPYPGFQARAGATGEYNGKFMSSQFVLKGASCATPRGHSRASYRNFFHPHQRWQFTGMRLARDSI